MVSHKNFTPSKNPSILLASLATVWVSHLDLDNGTVWHRGAEYHLQADYYLTEYLKDNKSAKAVVSFQRYPNQENVAVARLHRELVQ